VPTFLGRGQSLVQGRLGGPNIPVSAGRTTNLKVTLSAAVEDTITVTAESPILDERRTGNTQTFELDDRPSAGSGRRRKPKKEPSSTPAYYDFDAFQEMQTSIGGLVEGVKPLPVTIPESGKLLLLTGVLPPAEIGVELEVRTKKD
jgi:hypothetical protein